MKILSYPKTVTRPNYPTQKLSSFIYFNLLGNQKQYYKTL